MNPQKGWQAYADCKGMDPELFCLDIPVEKRRVARSICKECPVKMACLESQMEYEKDKTEATRERMLYGGLSATKRFRLQEQRDREAARASLVSV